MVNYSDGKIYRIVNTENETIYIGSTCQALSRRLATHKHRGNGNKIVLVKECPCENNEQLRREEQLCIEEHEGLVNEVRAYRTEEQKKEQFRERQRKYYEANREKLIESKRKYTEANREKVRERDRKYNEANREKRIEYQRKYNEANREKRIENHRKYNELNREKIREQQLEKITCEHCGSRVSRVCIARHQRSRKCVKARETTAEP